MKPQRVKEHKLEAATHCQPMAEMPRQNERAFISLTWDRLSKNAILFLPPFHISQGLPSSLENIENFTCTQLLCFWLMIIRIYVGQWKISSRGHSVWRMKTSYRQIGRIMCELSVRAGMTDIAERKQKTNRVRCMRSFPEQPVNVK